MYGRNASLTHAALCNPSRGTDGLNYIGVTFFFLHIHMWFPTSYRDFRRFGSDFRTFCKVITEKIHCGRYKIDHGCPWLVCLYFIEITLYRSGFLGYNLTRVNSVCTGVHDGFSISYVVNAMMSWLLGSPWYQHSLYWPISSWILPS